VDERSLTLAKRWSAVAAVANGIGFIALTNYITGASALVTFAVALYFSLRKPV
jgi:hypothetical protein